jgi:hypothetical protein
MSENGEIVYLIVGSHIYKCEIVRRTGSYVFVKWGEAEYKIHKSNENSEYILYKRDKWRPMIFYKPTEKIEHRYKKYIIVSSLEEIGFDIHQKPVLDDGFVFGMVERMKEFISQVELNRNLFQGKESKEINS